jgi:hypothetical protein
VERVTRIELARPTGKLGLKGRSMAQKLMAHVVARGPVRSFEGARRHGESCPD